MVNIFCNNFFPKKIRILGDIGKNTVMRSGAGDQVSSTLRRHYGEKKFIMMSLNFIAYFYRTIFF